MDCGSPSKTSGADGGAGQTGGTQRGGDAFRVPEFFTQNIVQPCGPLTVLLRPGVQLLLQVDDLDAQTLLAVRPLQVRLWPDVPANTQTFYGQKSFCKAVAVSTAAQLTAVKPQERTREEARKRKRTCSGVRGEEDDPGSSSSTSSPFSLDRSVHILLWEKDNSAWTHRRPVSSAVRENSAKKMENSGYNYNWQR